LSVGYHITDFDLFDCAAFHSEFREIERQRELARHNEASALKTRERKTRAEERMKWQGVVAEKDAKLSLS